MSATEDKEKKVSRGERLRIKASTFNDLLDLSRDHKRSKFNVGGFNPSALIRSNLGVLVYNSIGDDLTLPFQVVKIKQPLLDISEDVLNANVRPTFIGILPEDTFDAIGITQEPIQDGEIGNAVINGITIVKVKFTAIDHTWANPVVGESDYLESAELGQARILMDLGTASGGLTESGDELDSGEEEGSGSGLIGDIRWCMVNLIGAIFADTGSASSNIGAGVLTEATGAASLNGRTTTSGFSWTSSGVTKADKVVPLLCQGATFPINPTAEGLYWEEPAGSDRYGFLPFQYCSSTFAGMISTGTQDIPGAKTFKEKATFDKTGTGIECVNSATFGGATLVTLNGSAPVLLRNGVATGWLGSDQAIDAAGYIRTAGRIFSSGVSTTIIDGNVITSGTLSPAGGVWLNGLGNAVIWSSGNNVIVSGSATPESTLSTHTWGRIVALTSGTNGGFGITDTSGTVTNGYWGTIDLTTATSITVKGGMITGVA